MILSPNEIAALIYWSGSQFGPNMTPKATAQGGHIVQHIPKPGSPERTNIEHWLDTAIAICLAESGGDSNAKNSSSSASGLWQIMVSAHAKEIKDATIYWETELADGKNLTIFDPRVNTMAAALVYQAAGNSWSPWSTYTSGAYKKNLGHGKAAYSFITNKSNLEKTRKTFLDNLRNDSNLVNNLQAFVPGAGLIKGVDNVAGWLSPILDFLKQGALAVGIFLLGVILAGLGLWTMIRKTPVGKGVKSAVKLAAVV